ncbi:MAG: CotH kinase family protein [Planctomycetota bacterium]
MPATLRVDGATYADIGVRFRGASSFFMIPAGRKRSLNLELDFRHKDQSLNGVRTLHLLNCNGDASMMSTALYSWMAGQVMPAPRANFARVVINGEDWGVYSNVEQFGKDFVKAHFDGGGGTRWKVSGSPRGDGGLRYLGDEIEPYRERFEIKGKDKDSAWRALIGLCKLIESTPVEQLPEALAPHLDLDGVLWFLALDVATANSDGYWTRASDYSIYLDEAGVFHVIPHDMNEAFQDGHGGPPGAWEVRRPGSTGLRRGWMVLRHLKAKGRAWRSAIRRRASRRDRCSGRRARVARAVSVAAKVVGGAGSGRHARRRADFGSAGGARR